MCESFTSKVQKVLTRLKKEYTKREVFKMALRTYCSRSSSSTTRLLSVLFSKSKLKKKKVEQKTNQFFCVSETLPINETHAAPKGTLLPCSTERYSFRFELYREFN